MGAAWSHNYDCICVECKNGAVYKIPETPVERYERTKTELLKRIAEAQNEYQTCSRYDRQTLHKIDAHNESARKLWDNFNKNCNMRGFTFSVVHT